MTAQVETSAPDGSPPRPPRPRFFRWPIAAMVFALVALLGGGLWVLVDRQTVPVGDYETVVEERDDAQARLGETDGRIADLQSRAGDLETDNAELRSATANLQAELDQTKALLEAASRPETQLATLAEPFTVGDFEVELLTVAFELPSAGGFVVARADMDEGDIPLTLELHLLTGDFEMFGQVETWLVSDQGAEIGVSAELLSTNDAGYTRIFALSEQPETLILHFSTGETFDLRALLGEPTSAIEPPTTQPIPRPAPPQPTVPTTSVTEFLGECLKDPNLPNCPTTTTAPLLDCLTNPALCPRGPLDPPASCAMFPDQPGCAPSITLPPPPWEQ